MHAAGYETAVITNAKAQEIIAKWRLTQDRELICQLHKLVEPYTLQEINRIIGKLYLSAADAQDMLQDAFIKLSDCLGYFDETRNPLFIPWWRRVIHNHLISSYFRNERSSEIIDDLPAPPPLDMLQNTDFIAAIRKKFEKRISELKEPKHRLLALDILNYHLLVPPDQAVPQDTIASSHGKAQCYVSKWVVWLRGEIRTAFQDQS